MDNAPSSRVGDHSHQSESLWPPISVSFHGTIQELYSPEFASRASTVANLPGLENKFPYASKKKKKKKPKPGKEMGLA